MNDFYFKSIELMKIEKGAFKYKKSNEYFDYFFSLDDVNHRYQAFLQSAVESAHSPVQTTARLEDSKTEAKVINV